MGIDVATCGDSHPTLNHRSEVGDDVAEHVIGDDDVEPLRVFDEPHGSGVHVGIIALDVRVILLADFVEGALPEIECVSQHVGLAAERQFFRPVALAGKLEGEAQAAFDSAPGVDALL